MLLPEDIHPENSLYFSGAIVLKCLRKLQAATFMDLFVATQDLRTMSMPIFVLSLDWLFLADCVQKNSNGMYELCF